MGLLNRDTLHRPLHTNDPSATSTATNISNLSNDSSDVELVDLEILDSEEELDDPFRAFNNQQRRRPDSAPSQIHQEKTRKTNTKRASTDPGDQSRLRKKNKPQTMNLLEILLPENYDLSVSQNDFSALQCSTQATMNDISRVNDDKKRVMTDGVGADTDTEEDDSETELLGMEKISTHNDNDVDDDDEYEETVDESAVAIDTKKDIPVNIEVSTDEDEEDEEVEYKGTTNETHEEDCSATKEFTPNAASLQKDHTTTPQTTITNISTTQRRINKRKSTLEELCSKTRRVPYRVGLSKRANVNHLHPNLKK